MDQTELESAQQNIQANLLRAGRYTDDSSRDWTLYFFFRIMTKAEVEQTVDGAIAMMADPENTALRRRLLDSLAEPSASWSIEGKRESPDSPPTEAQIIGDLMPMLIGSDPQQQPALQFRYWLKALVCADMSGLIQDAKQLAGQLFPTTGADPTAVADPTTGAVVDPTAVADPTANAGQWLAALASPDELGALAAGARVDAIKQLLRLYACLLHDQESFRRVMRLFGDSPDAAGAKALESLGAVTIYELLRQFAPATVGAGAKGIVRGETDARPVDQAHTELTDGGRFDPLPVNVAFTFAGLSALKLDQDTLASFPEPFKQGMAARAARLGDTGPSAPANWEGEYGLPSIHGFFTGGFPAGGENQPIKACVWERLRNDIEDFNDRRSGNGCALRTVLGLLFRQFGLEIVRIELGQHPYNVDKDTGNVVQTRYRLEHFGFRDGLSQPFANGLGPPPPGGGTPDGVGKTWSPVAPGELFLDMPDEDGVRQQLPINEDLRRGATYIVFRKLEQDVSGFRAFLAQQRPGSKQAQERLAAQFVGRWKSGEPLMRSPDADRAPESADPAALNDFRYAADDPWGAKCPLGAHVRRANPRDIGLRGEVKRHRILRRGISYGGPLLPDDSHDDGRSRGLLFVAANSRIDLQFEVIQADWLNGGELLGQAGLARCPLAGSNEGGVEDSFLEAGAAAPVVYLPRFVVTRGGEYFFWPGLETLRKLADGETFPPTQWEMPYEGLTMVDATTPLLFAPSRLAGYAGQILASEGADSVVHLELPLEGPASALQAPGRAGPSAPQKPPQKPPQKIAFVGQYNDVIRVLGDAGSKFSVAQYHSTGQRITRGSDFIVGTEPARDTADARKYKYRLLCEAWQKLGDGRPDYVRRAVSKIVERRVEPALTRASPIGRIDLVHDLAVQAAYGVVTDLFGVPGPDSLTELAITLPFGSQHVASLPPDWLAAARGAPLVDPGLTSMQIWSLLILADMLGNLQSDHEAGPFSRQAGAEMLMHIDAVLAAADAEAKAGRRPQREPTLVDALIDGAPPQEDPDRGVYFREAAIVLMELIGDTLAAIPATFGKVLDFLLKERIDLSLLAKRIDLTGLAPAPQDLQGWERLIYEAERLNPILPVLLRHCEATTTLPGRGRTQAGELVAAAIGIANLDPRAFPSPTSFSLDPIIPGPSRDLSRYLIWGGPGVHQCWGRDLVAMPVLVECMRRTARLEGLLRVAGAAGQTQSLVGVTIALPARFTRADPRARSADRAPGRSRRPPPSLPQSANPPAPAS